MAIISDRPFGEKLCKILGIDASKTKNIVIKVMTDEVVLVQISQYLLDKEAGEFLELIKEYELKLKE